MKLKSINKFDLTNILGKKPTFYLNELKMLANDEYKTCFAKLDLKRINKPRK